MRTLTDTQLYNIVKAAAKEAVIQTIEAYRQYGDTVSRSDIIREIGLPLYNQGLANGDLTPAPKVGSNGKIRFQTTEYLRYKSKLFD